MTVLALTPEVLHEAILYLDPVDVSSLSRTCRALHALTDSDTNALLWKLLFLQHFDPLDSADKPGVRYPITRGLGTGGAADYAKLLKERCRARGIVRCPHRDKKIANREAVLQSLVDVLLTASCGTYGLSKNAAFLSHLLASKASIEDWLTAPLPKRPPIAQPGRNRRRAVALAVGGEANPIGSEPVTDESEVDDTESESGDEDDEVPDQASVSAEATESSGADGQADQDEMALDVDSPITAEAIRGVTADITDMEVAEQMATSSSAPASTSLYAPRQSARIKRTHPPLPIPEDTQLVQISCRLHAAALSRQEIDWSSYASGQGYREIVYRCSNFDEKNDYGPFQKRADQNDKLQVDWKIVDAISRVMSLNVKSAWHQWADPEEMSVLPYGFDKAVFWKQPGPGRDWAGVEGSWSYVYSFVDYNDFFAYNFAAESAVHNRYALNDLDGISEAVGGVNTLKLRLEEDAPKDGDGFGAEEEDEGENEESELYPTLRFVGESASPNGSIFRGTVRLLESGDRHWEMVIRYSGADRWITEGVEIGGRGIYGIWSDVLHEDLSPCGPVWYFRE